MVESIAETTKVNGNGVTEKVSRFLSLSGWTAGRLAKSAGISSSTLSQYLSGQYPGDNDKISEKILGIIKRESEKSKLHASNKTFIETSIWRRYLDIAKATHLFQEIGVCYSDAGLGKTECGREYAKRFVDTILIEANPGYTATALFKELYAKLGSETHKTMHHLFDGCVNHLKGSGRLLIIDEAEQLPYRALELVRCLHDKAQIGILLTGMHKLLGNICGIRTEYAQLYSRVGLAATFESLQESDAKKIVEEMIPENCITEDIPDIWRIFHKESCGNTRRMFKLINRSIYIASNNGCAIDDDVIQAACKMVKVEKHL